MLPNLLLICPFKKPLQYLYRQILLFQLSDVREKFIERDSHVWTLKARRREYIHHLRRNYRTGKNLPQRVPSFARHLVEVTGSRFVRMVLTACMNAISSRYRHLTSEPCLPARTLRRQALE